MKLEVLKLAKEYIRPEIKESPNKDWVMNGDNNQMYKDIIGSYYGSPTNSAIIDSYARYIYGLGLNIQQNFVSKTDLRKICFDMVLFGEASFEVTPKGNLYHVEKNKLLPNKAEDGEIKSYWFSFDWDNQQKYPPKEIPTYGFGKKTENQVFVIKSNQVGQFYFGNPSYISALPYCEVESELANYYVNHIKNGMSFGHVINVNGGKPESEEDLNKFSRQIRNQLTGSTNAGKFLLSFNDNKESETTISALEVSDAHKQYDFLTQEAQNKICIAHKVVSGAILGITKSTGFSSNADEIETAFNETYLNVIQPVQENILDAIEFVKGLSNLEFVNLREEEQEVITDTTTGVTTDVVSEDLIKKEASYNGAQIASSLDIMQAVKDGVLTVDQAITFLIQMLQFEPAVAKALFQGNSASEITMSKEKHVCLAEKKSKKKEGTDLIADELINLGEEINDDEWELIDEVQMNGEPTFGELELKLAKVPSSFPNVKSEQDTSLFKIRYQYAGEGEGQREFCNKMIKANKVYRKEDIELASTKVVNPGFGPKGADTYNLWLYKGSVNCKHFWMRKIYLRRNNSSLSVNEARKMILALDPKDRKDAKWEENDKLVAQPAQASNNYFRLEQ
jgi:hypothetical protein